MPMAMRWQRSSPARGESAVSAGGCSPGGAEYLRRDRRSRADGARLPAPGEAGESRRAGGGDGMLCAAGARGSGAAGRGGRGGRQQPQGTAGAGMRGAVAAIQAAPSPGSVRPAGLSPLVDVAGRERRSGAGGRSLCARQPGGGGSGSLRRHAAEPEGAGRLRKPVLVLHHSDDPGRQPVGSSRHGAGARLALCGGEAARSWCSPASTWAGGGGSLSGRHGSRIWLRRFWSGRSLPRLRISSVEPMDWSADLLALYRQYGRVDAAKTGPRLARHAHLPLQSGSDAILRAMHRRYRPWHYAEKLAAIRGAMPEAAIGADVMVGFPGETDALFEESLPVHCGAALHLSAPFSVQRAAGNRGMAAGAGESGAGRAGARAHGAAARC